MFGVRSSKNIEMAELKVFEAYGQDMHPSKNIVRIDFNTLLDLNVSKGGPVEVTNPAIKAPVEKSVYNSRICKALELSPSEDGTGIIRLPAHTRQYIGTAIQGMVHVKKVQDFKDAEKLVLMPMKDIPPVAEDWITRQLNEEYVRKGDLVHIGYFNGVIGPFQLLGFSPNDANVVRITKETQCYLAERTS